MIAPADTYRPYGDARQLFGWLDGSVPVPDECIFEGVTKSGKTRAAAEWVRAVASLYPDSKGLVLRKEKTTLVDAWQDIFEKQVLGYGHPALASGGNGVHRDRYKHPSLGGEIVLGGMDRPLKLFSTNYDWVYVNECQELTKNEWESLIRSTFGRNSSVPFRVLWGDCNPAEFSHWANQRCIAGIAKRLRGRFWDNPLLFDHDKYSDGLARGEDAKEWGKACWTDEGRRTLQRFARTMTGHRHARLYLGKWVSAEGAVWPDWDEAVHLIDAKLIKDSEGHALEWGQRLVRLRWFIGSHDVGFIAPGVAQVWGMDDNGTAYRVAEVYRKGWDHEQWADVWGGLATEFPLSAVVCDHDKAFQAQMNRKIVRKAKDGLPFFRDWDKQRGPSGEKAGIDEVRTRMRVQGGGHRGLYLVRGALRHGRDPLLDDAQSPCCTEEEIDSYVYPEIQDGKPVKESPVKVGDHGCDAMRGAICFVTLHDWAPKPEEERCRPGSLGDLMRHDEVLGRGRNFYAGKKWRNGELV